MLSCGDLLSTADFRTQTYLVPVSGELLQKRCHPLRHPIYSRRNGVAIKSDLHRVDTLLDNLPKNKAKKTGKKKEHSKLQQFLSGMT